MAKRSFAMPSQARGMAKKSNALHETFNACLGAGPRDQLPESACVLNASHGTLSWQMGTFFFKKKNKTKHKAITTHS